MKKNFLKSALALQAHKAALESIDGVTQAAADDAQAAQAVAGANLPVGQGAAPASTQETILTEQDSVAAGKIDESVTGVDLTPANEALTDRVKGFFLGALGNSIYTGSLGKKINIASKELEALTDDIIEVSKDAGQAAVKAGKLSSADFKKTFDADDGTVLEGAIRGYKWGAFAGASMNNKLAELKKQIKKKTAELDTLLQDAAVSEHAIQSGLVPGNEAFTDRVKGYFAGGSRYGWYGREVASEVSVIKKQIEGILEDIAEVSADNGKKAISEGKLTAADFKRDYIADPEEAKKGFIRGMLWSGIYGASKNNELANLKKKLAEKTAELDSLLKSGGETLTPANEAFSDRVKGYFMGGLGVGWYGRKVASEVNTVQKQIEGILEDIAEVSADNGKKAIAEGKLTAGDFKRDYIADVEAAKKGFVRGMLWGGIYGASKNNELAELKKKLAAKTKELEEILQKAGATPANESEDDADAMAAEAPEAEAPEAAPAEGEASGDDTTPAPVEAEAPEAAEGSDAPAEAEAPMDAPADDVVPDEGGEDAGSMPGEEADPAVGDVSDAAATGADQIADVATDEADNAISGEIEGQMGEVDQAAGEIADVESDVETMNDALESLDNCSAILRASIQRGGLDQFGGALLRNNLNTVTRNLKIRPLPLPALEDMEDPSAKIDAADTANAQVTGLMENISNTVREGLTRFGKWISDTTTQLTDVYARLEKRADLLGQRAQAAEGDKTENVTVHGMIAGDQPVQNLGKFLQDLEKTVAALGNPQTYDGYMQLLDTAEELVKTPGESEALAAKATQQLLGFRKKLAQVVKANGDQLAVHFLGGRSVMISVPADLHQLADFSAKVQKTKEDQFTDAPAMKQKEVIALCAKVKEMAGAYRASMAEANGTVKQLNKRISDKMGVVVDLSSRLDPKDGDQGGNLRKVASWVSRIVMTSAKLPVHAVYAEVPRTLSIALDCASKSIGAQRPAVAPEVASAQ